MTKKQKNVLIRIITAGVLTLALHFIVDAYADTVKEPVWFILHMVPYLLIGHDILWKAFKGIKNGQVFDENFLMCVATIGAIVLALVEQSADYMEAIEVMLFYQIGELFQSYAIGKSRRNISEMMDIRPDYAVVKENGTLKKVDPDEVAIGTIITVSPGEKVPIDGVVVAGAGTVDSAALTGESKPREVAPGDEIMSGCIDQNVVFEIRTTKEFEESTASKILDLVENATSQKAKSEAFISRFARVYTPIVCFLALALALLVPAARGIIGMQPMWREWVYRALTFLVISCPCALVISIPLSFFAGIGGASRQGILVKGSNYLEELAKTKAVAFDKTGTMTKGVFEVNAIHKSTIDRTKLLEIAAHAESYSSHPIAKSIERAWTEGLSWNEDGTLAPIPEDVAGRTIDRARVSDLQEIGGNGIITKVDGQRVVIGSAKLMIREGIAYQECEDDFGTIVHVAVDGQYVGHILISDVVKLTSAEAIQDLHEIGVEQTVMLTGDAKRVAEEVAGQIGIRDVRSDLLPADKVRVVEELLSRKTEGTTLAFVGDGLNDAPVLTRADVGIAMGALGADAAIEAADVVLMDDDPRKIALSIRIAKKCMRIVRENIWGAIGIKIIVLILGVFGYSSMGLAIFADVGVMVIAVLNAIRALFIRK